MKVMVLGGGRVGSAIVRDLADGGDFDVAVADISRDTVQRLASTATSGGIQADLSDPGEVRRVVRDSDLVVGAMPGPMGFATVEAVIEAGKPIVDISFFAEDPLLLDAKARERGVVAVTDCGVAPGCSNLILGSMEATFEGELESFTCYVGGLPQERRWPYEYRAVFSPIDVIAEYTRPARMVEHGRVVTRPALTELELVDFPRVGTLEAFNTDGLRTLLKTSKVPFMREKTLRYPGHVEKMRMMRETGFFSEEPIDVGGIRVRPLDVTSQLLFPTWELGPGEEDLTVMRIVIDGIRDDRVVRHTFEMLDRYDRITDTTSMARTTGYTCTAVIRALAEGLYASPGVSPPELLGRTPGLTEYVLARLAERGVALERVVEEL